MANPKPQLTVESFREHFLPGMALSEFERSHFRQKPLHLKSSDPTYFSNICPPGAISTLFEEQLLVKPSVRMVRSDGVLPISEITSPIPYGRFAFEDVVDVEAVQKRFEQGYTINFRAAHLQLPSLRKAALILADIYNCYVRANLYITPDSQAGLRPHYDVDDVFVLQISGSKRWMLYDGVFERPTRTFQFDEAAYDVGSPTTKVQLDPGDVLYVPGGTPHSAVASGTSCHVTFGIEEISKFSFLREVFADLENMPLFRETLEPTSAEQQHDYLREILSSAVEALSNIPAERLSHTAKGVVAANRKRMLDRNTDFLSGL